MYIRSEALTNLDTLDTASSAHNVIKAVVVNQPFGTTIVDELNSNDYIDAGQSRELKLIDFKITSDNSKILQFNGAEVNFTICFLYPDEPHFN